MSGIADFFRHAATQWLNVFRLSDAAASGDNQRVRALIAAGANVHSGDDWALLCAVRGYCRRHWVGAKAERREDTLRALLDAGADVHARHDRALRIAVSMRRTDGVKILLEAGADIHSLNRFQRRKLQRLFNEDQLARAIVLGSPAATQVASPPSQTI